MIKAEIQSWSDFKTKVTARGLLPQFYERVRNAPNNNQYRIYAIDGFMQFEWIIEKDNGADQIDFETNYKNSWNAKLEHRNDKGIIKQVISPRPDNTVTYFPGKGDNANSIMQFDLTTALPSVSKVLTFSENIYIKDAVIIMKDAPIGSYIEANIKHPATGDTLQYFLKNYNLLGTGIINVNSEDQEMVPAGLELHVTVYNSDPKQAFQVVGNLEMYRVNTL